MTFLKDFTVFMQPFAVLQQPSKAAKKTLHINKENHTMADEKFVYFFGNGKAEGSAPEN